MTDIEYKLADLINFSSRHSPIDFEQAFNSIISSKLASVIDQKKFEIGQTMFNTYDDEEEEELHDQAA
jgi:hypothetical protein